MQETTELMYLKACRISVCLVHIGGTEDPDVFCEGLLVGCSYLFVYDRIAVGVDGLEKVVLFGFRLSVIKFLVDVFLEGSS